MSVPDPVPMRVVATLPDCPPWCQISDHDAPLELTHWRRVSAAVSLELPEWLDGRRVVRADTPRITLDGPTELTAGQARALAADLMAAADLIDQDHDLEAGGRP